VALTLLAERREPGLLKNWYCRNFALRCFYSKLRLYAFAKYKMAKSRIPYPEGMKHVSRRSSEAKTTGYVADTVLAVS